MPNHPVKKQRQESGCAAILAVLDVALARVLEDLVVQGLEAAHNRVDHFIPVAALVVPK